MWFVMLPTIDAIMESCNLIVIQYIFNVGHMLGVFKPLDLLGIGHGILILKYWLIVVKLVCTLKHGN